jgi:glycosyltransferase involved in cell wall biosynthesis
MKAVIVVPCYNESARWNTAYWTGLLALPDISWLFVDDGSTDDTATLISATAASDRAGVLLVAPNGGKAEAVRRGMLEAMDIAADAGAVGFMDADGAFNAADVQDLLTTFVQRTTVARPVDAVWSSRVALAGRDIRRSIRRHYIGRVVATFVSVGQDEIPYDTQSGLKLFSPSNDLRGCLQAPFQTRWLFELELLSRWHQATGAEMRIWEEPLNFWHDVPGSKITMRESFRVVRELILVKRQQRSARIHPRP